VAAEGLGLNSLFSLSLSRFRTMASTESGTAGGLRPSSGVGTTVKNGVTEGEGKVSSETVPPLDSRKGEGTESTVAVSASEREREIRRLLDASAQVPNATVQLNGSTAAVETQTDGDGDFVMRDSASTPKTSPLDNPDDATVAKAQAIMEREIEAELEYKTEELALIQTRLTEVETLLEKLRACAEGGRGRGRGKAREPMQQQAVKGARIFGLVDQKFVQLVCPACQRVKFTSQAGFVNHCRMQHGLRFSSAEDAVVYCGVPVAESEIPPEDPVRQSLSILTKRHQSQVAEGEKERERKVAKASERETVTGGEASVPGDSTSALSDSDRGREGISEGVEKSNERDTKRDRGKERDSGRDDNENKSEGGTEKERETEKRDREKARESDMETERERERQRRPTRALDTVASQVSRFYVKMRVYIGNSSKHIPEALRLPGDMSTHKWMVYVRGPERDPDISHFVSKVRFFLHPSFKPNDVVEVTAPPFRIVRKGWGEFPVRVQLFFTSRQTKPVDYIHPLKLDHKKLGLAVLGHEQAVDVELDREFFVSKQHELEQRREEVSAGDEREREREREREGESERGRAPTRPWLPFRSLAAECSPSKSIRRATCARGTLSQTLWRARTTPSSLRRARAMGTTPCCCSTGTTSPTASTAPCSGRPGPTTAASAADASERWTITAR